MSLVVFLGELTLFFVDGICVRREEFACSIRYSAIGDFLLSPFGPISMIDSSCTRDYLTIPGGSSTDAFGSVVKMIGI